MTDIKITIEAPGLVDALNNLAGAIAGGAAQAAAPAVDAGKPTRAPRAGGKSKETDATPPSDAETPKETAKDTAAATDQETSSDQENGGSVSDDELTYDAVRKAVLDLTAKRGREATVNLLGQFADASGEPAKKGTDLVTRDWAEFIEKANGLIEGDLA